MIVFKLCDNPVHLPEYSVQEFIVPFFCEVGVEVVIIDCAEEAFQLAVRLVHFPYQHNSQSYDHTDADKCKE